MPNVVLAAVLAAGSSRRLGQPKQLLPYEGMTLLEHVVARVRATRCARVGVVVGASGAEVMQLLATHPVELLENRRWHEGLASSVRTAACWARNAHASGLLLCVADQPRLSTSHLDQLLDIFSEHGGAVGSRYADAVGVPAVLGAELFDELEALEGDRGARAVLARADARGVDWPDGAIDIDVPADLARM